MPPSSCRRKGQANGGNSELTVHGEGILLEHCRKALPNSDVRVRKFNTNGSCTKILTRVAPTWGKSRRPHCHLLLYFILSFPLSRAQSQSSPSNTVIMSAYEARPKGPFAPHYIHGVYIPAGLIIVGVFIVKREWLPYAVAVATILGAWKIYNNSKFASRFFQTHC